MRSGAGERVWVDSGVCLQAGFERGRVFRALENFAGGEAGLDVAALVADLGGRFAEGAELVLEVVELAADRDIEVGGVGASEMDGRAGVLSPRGGRGDGGKLCRGVEHGNILP